MSYPTRPLPSRGLRRKIQPQDAQVPTPKVEAGFDKETMAFSNSKPLPMIPTDSSASNPQNPLHGRPAGGPRPSRSSVFDLLSRPKVMLARGYSEQGMATSSVAQSRDEAQPPPPMNRAFSDQTVATQRALPKARRAHNDPVEVDPSPRLTGPWDPPALFQAYPQAIRHTSLQACSSTSGSIARGKRHLTSSRHWTRKVYVLATMGYLLQYAGEGVYDRRPEKVLRLNADSAAFASDEIPGKHFVLQVLESTIDKPVPQSSFLSRMGIQSSSTKRAASSMLLIFDSALDMNVWMMEIRKQIDILSGKKSHHDTQDDHDSEPRTPSHRFSVIRPRANARLIEDDSSVSSTFINSERSSTAIESECSTAPSNTSSIIVDEPLTHIDSPYILTPRISTPQLLLDENVSDEIFGDLNKGKVWDKKQSVAGDAPAINGLSTKNPLDSAFYRRRSTNTLAPQTSDGFLIPGIVTPARLKRYSTSGNPQEVAPRQSPIILKTPISSRSQQLPSRVNKPEGKSPLHSNPTLNTIHERQLSEAKENSIVTSEINYPQRQTMHKFRLELPPNSRKRLSVMHNPTADDTAKENPSVKAREPEFKQLLQSTKVKSEGRPSLIPEQPRSRRVPLTIRLPVNVAKSDAPAPLENVKEATNGKAIPLQRPQSFMGAEVSANVQRPEARKSVLSDSGSLSEFNYLFATANVPSGRDSLSAAPIGSSIKTSFVPMPTISSARTSLTLTPTISSTRTSVLLGPPSPYSNESVNSPLGNISPRESAGSSRHERGTAPSSAEGESPVLRSPFLTVPKPTLGPTSRPSSALGQRASVRTNVPLASHAGLPPMQPPPTIPLPSLPTALPAA